MAPKSAVDPVETFLRFVGQSEEAVNALALKVTASERFTRGAHTLSALNRGLVRRAEQQRAKVLRDLSLMSHQQFEQLSERVARLESLVERLGSQVPKAEAAVSGPPKRPARTRKPPATATKSSGRS